MRYCLLLLFSLITACSQIPAGLTVVDNFELNRYLGTWYEIARLDHRFERGLIDIHADYSLNNDGSVKIVNSGFATEQGQRQTAIGKAQFVDRPTLGSLEVSFFGPFYSAYNIIALDQIHYDYVMIAGADRDYLWILSRTPKLEQTILDQLINQANSLGFATDKLIFDQH